MDRKVGVTFWRGPENRGNIASGLEKRTSMRKGRVNGGQVKTVCNKVIWLQAYPFTSYFWTLNYLYLLIT